ncbi:flagellar protein FlgN [Microvirga makkahensis]|uniref:Flagellar protein FlgN n=1 Tax=Microvirga makkahensis TaxID=1128670 RepID=A0A7X3MRD7_9HYPH|nr:flagellar protein FlgN [Microvirga makkahensis]MXQ11685.1 flagellar protein FlgN [Microvirga makkahensis]
MLMKSLERLEETLDLETAALLSRDLSKLEDFNRRKSQSLLEISRMVRSVENGVIDENAVKRFQSLKSKLEENQAILERHMRAVQEISAVISGAIRAAESDSTYSADVAHRGYGA